MQHFELVTYLVVKTYKKGFKENLIEALKLYFKDKNDFEFPTKSKMIAFFGVFGQSRRRSKDEI